MPKGVICPNQVWCDSILTMLANQLRDVTEQDRFLAATPLTHMAIGFFWPFFVRGGATVTMRRFDVAQACELIARYEISHLVLVPTMLIMLINYLKQDERAMRCLSERFAEGAVLWRLTNSAHGDYGTPSGCLGRS